MAKSTYKGLVTVPDAATDSIDDGSTIGGDIVANFKKLADCCVIKKVNDCNPIEVALPAGKYLVECWSTNWEDSGQISAYKWGFLTINGENSSFVDIFGNAIAGCTWNSTTQTCSLAWYLYNPHIRISPII